MPESLKLMRNDADSAIIGMPQAVAVQVGLGVVFDPVQELFFLFRVEIVKPVRAEHSDPVS